MVIIYILESIKGYMLSIHAACCMFYGLRPMPYVSSPMPYVLCPTPYVLCPTSYALYYIRGVFITNPGSKLIIISTFWRKEHLQKKPEYLPSIHPFCLNLISNLITTRVLLLVVTHSNRYQLSFPNCYPNFLIYLWISFQYFHVVFQWKAIATAEIVFVFFAFNGNETRRDLIRVFLRFRNLTWAFYVVLTNIWVGLIIVAWKRLWKACIKNIVFVANGLKYLICFG